MRTLRPYIAHLLFIGMVGWGGQIGEAEAGEVSGRISGGVWTVADSPIRVTGDILLPQESSLRIERGVRVIFTGPYSFTVQGLLEVVGAFGEEVVFTSENPLIDSLRWRGLRLVGARRNSRIEFAIIEYGWARGPWPENCGGGLYIENCSPTIHRSVFKHNRADLDGGAIYSWNTSALIKNTLIVVNRADNHGGGIYIANGNPRLINCTVAVDTARGWGGGIFIGAGGRPEIVNTIAVFNHQILFLDDGDDFNNLPSGDAYMVDLARVQSARPEVSFSCITANQLFPFPGSGNITSDPLFVRHQSEPFDFRVKYSSPTIDAGDPRMNPGAEPDVLVGIIDMGAYGGTEQATLSVPVIYNDRAASGLILNFGQVRINNQVSQEIKIENRGHYRLTLHNFHLTDEDFFPDSTRQDGSLIPSYRASPIEPGELGKFAIQFRPRRLESYEDTLFLISSDTLFGVDSLHPAPYDPARRYPFIVLRGEGIDPIAVCDTIVDFSRQRIGSRTVKDLWITNRGRSRLDLSDVNIQGVGFDARIVNSRINPGDSGRVEITFIPTFPESYERAMSVRSNDRSLFITLKGRGFGPKMVLTDTLRFLGYVYYGGDTLRGEIPIRNAGDQDLVIDSVRVEPIVGPITAFTVEIPSGGLTVPANSTQYLAVRFHPPLPTQDYDARLYIYSNYPLVLTYRVKGRGMALPGRYVFGQVSGVWQSLPDDPPYIVLDSAIVPLEGRLRIMPGVVVRFEPGAFLRAVGQIRAIGTVTDSIFFLPRDTSGTPQSRWRGIEIRGENNSRLIYCVIQGSREGLRIHQSSPLIQYSTISHNGDSSQLGGGVFCDNSGAVIAGSRITENFAQQGGGIYILNSKVKVLNCLIRGNSALSGGAVIVRFLSAPLFQNNIVVGNSSEAGSIIIKESSTPWWVNNTIADNLGGAFLISSQSIPTILNCIIYANGGEGSLVIDPTANALVSYSFVDGGFPGTGNIAAPPPQFDHSTLPYALSDLDTAFIDRGNPERSHRDFSFPPSRGSSRNDLGAYGGPLSGGWGAPEIAISILQNPAFSRWLNLIITSQEPFSNPPLCSLEFGEEPMRRLAVQFIDSLTFGARYEAPGSGPILITAEADIGAGIRQKVSRDFQMIVATSGEGGYTTLSDGLGSLYLPKSVRERVVIMSVVKEPLKPWKEVLFLTLPIQIWGVASWGETPPQWKIAKPELPLSREGYSWKLFRQQDQTWEIIPSVTDEETITAFLTRDGTYAWGVMRGEESSSPPTLPQTVGISSYPNPFNHKAVIDFYLQEPEEVELKVYNLKGELIKTLMSGHRPKGSHRTIWDGTSDRGEAMPSGIYVIQLNAAHHRASYKTILMR